MKKNTVFMIIGGVFVAFCLLCYLGPRTLEAFIDPPEPDPAPVDPNKYTSQKQYLLDQRASVIHKQKQDDNTALNPVLNIFRSPNVVEGMTNCGTFGCCQKLNVAKSDKDGSNCNGFCPYKNTAAPGPAPPKPPAPKPPAPKPPAPKPPPPAPKPPPPAPKPPPPVPNPPPPVPPPPTYGSYMGNTNTVFIPPPVQSLNPPVQANGAGTGGATDDRLQPYNEEAKCGVCPKPQPCPACARCPEPSFDCKKVPNYSSTNSNYLPMPILTDFSTFGM